MPRPPSSRSGRRRARPPVPRSPAVALSRGLAFLAIPLARAQWQQPSGSRGAPQQQWQPPPPPQQWEWAREGDAAADGEAAPDPPAHEACAGCNEPPDKVCAETATTTLAEGECLQCSVAGTTWYPCSLVGGEARPCHRVMGGVHPCNEGCPSMLEHVHFEFSRSLTPQRVSLP